MPAPAAGPSRTHAMLSETHCPTRAERSGPTVAPCQTSPTPAREVPRLAGRRHAGNLSGLATCNAARSSTGTGFAGIANLPAHPLLRACCLQSAGSAQVRPTLRQRPLLPSTLVVAAFLWRPKTSRMKGQPAGQPFSLVRKPNGHSGPRAVFVGSPGLRSPACQRPWTGRYICVAVATTVTARKRA